MKLFDILVEVYGKKKDGNISHHALNFCKKYELDIEKEYDKTTLVLSLSKISNSLKREKALNIVMSIEEYNDNKVDINIIRQENYKTCCKIFHPDNKDTGNENVFKFIQDVKFAFWDCDGVVKKHISYYDWSIQKESREKAKNGIII